MYPTIEILGVQIYTFGALLSCTWLIFFGLLHHYSSRAGIIRPIFHDIVTFTISMFFFSRIFHILSDWVNEKFILMELVHGNILTFLRLFFTPADFLFSLSGAIFGFFLVFLLKTRKDIEARLIYLEVIIFAFLWSSLLGYFGALLGGQMYGTSLNTPFSIVYNHPDSIVQERTPLFPVAVLYIIVTITILIGLRKFSERFQAPPGYIGYLGLGMIGLMIFFGEFFSGKRKEMFYDFTSVISGGFVGISLNQITAIICISVAILGIIRLTEKRV